MKKMGGKNPPEEIADNEKAPQLPEDEKDHGRGGGEGRMESGKENREWPKWDEMHKDDENKEANKDENGHEDQPKRDEIQRGKENKENNEENDEKANEANEISHGTSVSEKRNKE